MVKLKTILASNLRTFRHEAGFSQAKLADLIDVAPNYITMIENEKRFPSDTIIEKIALALDKEPCEFFSSEPIKKDWQDELITELVDFLNKRTKSCSQRALHLR